MPPKKTARKITTTDEKKKERNTISKKTTKKPSEKTEKSQAIKKYLKDRGIEVPHEEINTSRMNNLEVAHRKSMEMGYPGIKAAHKTNAAMGYPNIKAAHQRNNEMGHPNLKAANRKSAEMEYSSQKVSIKTAKLYRGLPEEIRKAYKGTSSQFIEVGKAQELTAEEIELRKELIKYNPPKNKTPSPSQNTYYDTSSQNTYREPDLDF
jgi:hypothetical protein